MRLPLVLILLALLTACGNSAMPSAGPVSRAEPSAQGRWLAAWYAAPSDAAGNFRDQTLRVIATPRVSGARLRVLVSNRFGTRPVTFAAASIGLKGEGAALQPGCA